MSRWWPTPSGLLGLRGPAYIEAAADRRRSSTPTMLITELGLAQGAVVVYYSEARWPEAV